MALGIIHRDFEWKGVRFFSFSYDLYSFFYPVIYLLVTDLSVSLK